MPRNLVHRISGLASAICVVAAVAACATSPRAVGGPSTASTPAAGRSQLSGVDFRATGNEPGWHMEIANGEKILLVTDYGENRFEFPASPPDSSDGKTVYDVRAAGHHLETIIEDRSCIDSMSGRAFQSTVAVTIDGKKYNGCGGPPH